MAGNTLVLPVGRQMTDPGRHEIQHLAVREHALPVELRDPCDERIINVRHQARVACAAYTSHVGRLLKRMEPRDTTRPGPQTRCIWYCQRQVRGRRKVGYVVTVTTLLFCFRQITGACMLPIPLCQQGHTTFFDNGQEHIRLQESIQQQY